MNRLCILVSSLFVVVHTSAQNPFESLGKHEETVTFSKGLHDEAFDQERIVRIGTVLLDVEAGEIVAFVTEESTFDEANLEPSITSRWLSPDPLAEKYADWSPYNFVKNSPIYFIDPDGNAPFPGAHFPDWLIGPLVSANSKFSRANSSAQGTIRAWQTVTETEASYSMKFAHYLSSYIREFGQFTSSDDVSVLGKGVHADNTRANLSDKILAGTFLFLPISGAAVKEGSKNLYKLYRAASIAEIDDIANTQKLNLIEGGSEVKYFGITAQDAYNEGIDLYKGNLDEFKILELEVSEDIYQQLYKGEMDIGIMENIGVTAGQKELDLINKNIDQVKVIDP